MTDKKHSIWTYLISTILIIVFFSGAISAVNFLMTHKPKAKKRRFKRKVLVKTMKFAPVNHTTIVSTMGTVKPFQQIGIFPQIGGKLTKVSPKLIPGGFLRKGEFIAQIDALEEKQNIAQKKVSLSTSKAHLAKAKQDLFLAEQRLKLSSKQAHATLKSAQTQYLEAQAKADRQKKLMQSNLTSQELYDAAKTTAIQKATDFENAKLQVEELKNEEIAIKLKHSDVALAKFQVEHNEIELAKAQRRFGYTNIKAPFNALILKKFIAPGSKVTTSTQIAILVATHKFWIEVAIAIDRLPWIKIPYTNHSKGSMAQISHISWKQGVSRKGYIARLVPEVESQGRMAKLLIGVDDPLNREMTEETKELLLLNSFVRVKIKGKILQNVICLPRDYLHDGHWVWILKKKKLEKRHIKIIWREKNYVYIAKGIKVNEKIVISDVPGAVSGMKVKEVKS